MFRHILEYVQEEPEYAYNLIIGTDSLRDEKTSFVTAVVIHRVGKGGRYFYRKHFETGWKIENLRQRIYHETSLSLELASRIAEELANKGSELPIEIHLDVGDFGETRKVIKEVVGMVTGSGFMAKTKPESFGASHIADKHSK